MPTVTVRELRNNFPMVAALLAAGEQVTITRHGKIIGTIAPPAAHVAKVRPPFPDIAARHKALWGDRVFDAEETRQVLAYTRGDRS
jgi:antitoxin (DNA-binding transcriptional repressor) of toxin-antitoxin stability system